MKIGSWHYITWCDDFPGASIGLGRTKDDKRQAIASREAKRELDLRGMDEARCFGLMAGKLRLLYKLGVGPWMARRLEPLDDWASRLSWTAPFAGHLVVIARRRS